MNNRNGRSDKAEPPESREDRLKAALRANLQRRKAQARARSEPVGEGEGDVDPSGTDKE